MNEYEVHSFPQIPDGDFSKWRLDPDTILELLERHYRGQIWNAATKSWEAIGKKLMNDQGISMMISAAAGRINKVTMLTSFKEEEIFMMMQNFELHLIALLFEKYEEFEIQSLADADFIVEITVDLAFAAIKKSQDAGERESLDRNEQMIRHIMTGEQQRSRIPRIFGRRKEEGNYG